ncbi:hybrid sensor histidine kinase/response regulator [Noviherbaspirillum sp.]|uniref:hybrid sensor histidine kinase/response regulator n=1 Tax=Noviherbaspirillum sp. TaxID=1926288 RepID=UPI002B46404F|nr:response regulator [Noviherbaspirillum sp.]HJV80126.1 response regulator [Noviherbaspirillum sp.]
MQTFRVEAEEHLQNIVSQVVLLEQKGESPSQEQVERILKTLHTLKGAARAVDLTDLETLCHAMENVFSAMRTTGDGLAAEQFDLVHQACGLARTLTNEPPGRARNLAGALAQRLNSLSAQLDAGATSVPAAPDAAQRLPDEDDEPAHQAVRTNVVKVEGQNLDAIRYQTEALLSVELGLQQHIADLLALADNMAEYTARLPPAEPISHRRARSARSMQSKDAAGESKAPRTDKVREDFELQCRRLANAIGRTQRDFSTIRSRLLDATLETALVPCTFALEQLPGLVRNLARTRAKEAVLYMQGESTRMDRRILDTIREVMIHLVTNAVDHGIEAAEKRLAAGKSAAGAIRITVAQCSDNRVAFTLSDDGAGIDVEAIIKAATGRGKLSAGQLAGLSDRQKLQLALHAGVSTSREVTHLSGRGVGLAIVAEKVASLGGELLIDNRPGEGCSFELLLPVRLATLRGLILRSRGAQFVLALSGIESVRALREGDIRTIENRETLLVRESVVPVIRLGHLLGLERVAAGPAGGENIALIARAGGTLFALLVDEILSEQEVLPKGLGKQLRRVRFIAGATQLGDGSLVPILRMEDIGAHGLTGNDAASAGRVQGETRVAKRILVVEDSITSRLLLKHILEGAGYAAETAIDGLDALSKLRQGNFDAVVSDVEMPQMDGLELTAQVRANPKTEELPVILVTSLQSSEEKERGLRAGADAYVVKGAFDQDSLLATIRRLI